MRHDNGLGSNNNGGRPVAWTGRLTSWPSVFDSFPSCRKSMSLSECSMNRRSIVVVLAALLPALLPAQAVTHGDSTSAPIRDVRYDVTFMRQNGQQRAIDVAMSFSTTGALPVVLSLP